MLIVIVVIVIFIVDVLGVNENLTSEIKVICKKKHIMSPNL